MPSEHMHRLHVNALDSFKFLFSNVCDGALEPIEIPSSSVKDGALATSRAVSSRRDLAVTTAAAGASRTAAEDPNAASEVASV